jgi:hypothetical protein
LIANASFAKPECTRLLIQAGGNVQYVYSGDNASVLFMLAHCFSDRTQNMYCPGDYILAADLLVEAGAPVYEIQDDGP